MKIVVFDLDETLGYFTEYGIFWDILNNYLKIHLKYPLTNEDFNSTLDLYPEFIRPNIINILIYLKNKKLTNCCNKIMIYTNNNGPKEWAQNIIKYFENKINYALFDQIISAFKINGKTVEICRTTHNKTHQDLISCTKIPMDAEICFLDDNFYPEMAKDNIYYINIKPFFYDLKFDYIISKFQKSALGRQLELTNDVNFEKYMMNEFKKINYTLVIKDEKEYEIDKILGKQIMIHLQNFFNKTIKKHNRKSLFKTKKTYTNKKNKSQKIRK
uniref:Uncharacterized protein n=1 Tax=viral metagenome TaxID=1070528 RepID=A0A6C0EQB7_9ZZZZ